MNDSEMLAAVLGIGFVVVVAAGTAMFAALRTARDRRHRLAAWARARGWTLSASVPELTTRWSGHPFDTGGDPVAENVLSGPFDGHQAVVFDFSHLLSNQRGSLVDELAIDHGAAGARRQIRRAYAVHALSLPAGLPWVHLTAERRTDRIASRVFGAQDIEFESVEFNDAYRVRADDARLAYDVVNPQTMDVLLAAGAPDVRIDGGSIVLVTPDVVELDMVDAALTVLATVVENVPDHVWADRGAAPRSSPHPGTAS